ncbi:Uncharacterised protein [Mycobacteroides abscessus subsp. abscessus]|nr:Uncharacterised protein [Mycobacteroides abscessus subsp. abscessus]
MFCFVRAIGVAGERVEVVPVEDDVHARVLGAARPTHAAACTSRSSGTQWVICNPSTSRGPFLPRLAARCNSSSDSVWLCSGGSPRTSSALMPSPWPTRSPSSSSHM